jgi:hypothetical protein
VLSHKHVNTLKRKMLGEWAIYTKAESRRQQRPCRDGRVRHLRGALARSRGESGEVEQVAATFGDIVAWHRSSAACWRR